MIDTKELSEAIVEVLDIIKHMDEDMIQLIPLDVIKELNTKRSLTYKANIDYTKSLEENNLKHTTKVLLALLYRDYICTEEEQVEIDNLLKLNEINRKNNSLFENDIDNSKDELKLVPVIVKKNIFQKIIDKLINRVYY